MSNFQHQYVNVEETTYRYVRVADDASLQAKIHTRHRRQIGSGQEGSGRVRSGRRSQTLWGLTIIARSKRESVERRLAR